MLAGSMDGSVSLLNAATGALLHSAKAHMKYVVAVAWAGDGQHFVSASWDCSLTVHRFTSVPTAPGDSCSFVSLKTFRYTAAVLCAAFLADGKTCVVGLRDSNYLRLIDTMTLQVASPAHGMPAPICVLDYCAHPCHSFTSCYELRKLLCSQEDRKNMNQHDYDNHVSFYASHLALSPCGKLLLISTEGSRLVIFHTADWRQVSSLYGLPTADFHQPCACWLHSTSYVAAAAAGGQVVFFHVGSGKVTLRRPGDDFLLLLSCRDGCANRLILSDKIFWGASPS